MNKQDGSEDSKWEPEDEPQMPEDIMTRTAYGLWALDVFEAEREDFEACCARTDQLKARNDPTGDPQAWLEREIRKMEKGLAAKKKSEGEMPDA